MKKTNLHSLIHRILTSTVHPCLPRDTTSKGFGNSSTPTPIRITTFQPLGCWLISVIGISSRVYKTLFSLISAPSATRHNTLIIYALMADTKDNIQYPPSSIALPMKIKSLTPNKNNRRVLHNHLPPPIGNVTVAQG